MNAGSAARGNGHTPSRNPAARWPFWPVHMRIHPLTRLVTGPAPTSSPAPSLGGSGHWLLETRIEFTDADGQTSKAVGQMTIQLYESPTMPLDQGRVKTWNADLTLLNVNREHYDDVTRTYLFRLGIEPNDLTEQSQLRALFVSADGQKFEDRLLVRH